MICFLPIGQCRSRPCIRSFPRSFPWTCLTANVGGSRAFLDERRAWPRPSCNSRPCAFSGAQRPNLRQPQRQARSLFFSLDAAHAPAVWAARTFYHLPYFFADMNASSEGEEIKYTSTRREGQAAF